MQLLKLSYIVLLVFSSTVFADECKVVRREVDTGNQTTSFTEYVKYCKNADGWAVVPDNGQKSGPASASSYGSIYYDPNTGARGSSNNYKNQDDAEKHGEAACRKNTNAWNCTKITTFSGAQCGALAVTSGDGWGGAARATKSLAESAAMDACQRASPKFSCRIVETVCTAEANVKMAEAAAEAERKKAYDQYILDSKAVTGSELQRFIEKYGSNDPDNLVPKAKAKFPAAWKAEQLYEYQQAKTSIQLTSLVEKYSNNDPNKLVAKAKGMQQAAAKRETLEAQQAAIKQRRDDEYRREHACDHLYAGKVVEAPITGLVSLFGITSEKAIVLGVSNRNGVATVRSVNNSSMVGELSCGSLQ